MSFLLKRTPSSPLKKKSSIFLNKLVKREMGSVRLVGTKEVSVVHFVLTLLLSSTPLSCFLPWLKNERFVFPPDVISMFRRVYARLTSFYQNSLLETYIHVTLYFLPYLTARFQAFNAALSSVPLSLFVWIRFVSAPFHLLLFLCHSFPCGPV